MTDPTTNSNQNDYTIVTFTRAEGAALVRRINAASRAGAAPTLTQQGATCRITEARWSAAFGGIVRVHRPAAITSQKGAVIAAAWFALAAGYTLQFDR